MPPEQPSDLLIREKTDLALIEGDGDGVFNADGTVNVAILRPCNGRGHGSRIYEADTLARDAHVFRGVTSFDNHESPAARRARAGLPRPPSELAGLIRESWWDGSYSTGDDERAGFGQGAVLGRMVLSDPMEALVRKMPEAIKLSVNAEATGLRRGERAGKQGWIVEGIANDPENTSVDLVTKAGAGGRVRSLIESLYLPDNDEHDGDKVTKDEILEALKTDDGKAAVAELRLVEAPRDGETPEQIARRIVEAEWTERERTLRESLTGTAPSQQDIESLIQEATSSLRVDYETKDRARSLALKARALIEATKLPGQCKSALLDDYSLDEVNGDLRPHRALAVIEAELDTDGNETKSAEQVLADAVDADVKRERGKLREAGTTFPLASGGGAGDPAPRKFGEGSAWAERLGTKNLDLSQFGVQKPAEATT